MQSVIAVPATRPGGRAHVFKAASITWLCKWSIRIGLMFDAAAATGATATPPYSAPMTAKKPVVATSAQISKALHWSCPCGVWNFKKTIFV